MSWWKQLGLSLVVAVAALTAWIAWMPEARPLLERAGIWPVLERSGAISAMAAVGITPAEAPQARGGGGPPGGFGGPPRAPTVTVDTVIEAEVNATVSAIGTGRAVRRATVTPEASGRLAELSVRSGEQVATGAVLARLDDRDERIAVDRATLELENATETADRLQRLEGTASAVQIRDAERALRTAELALAQAELELSRREVRAPIDGHVGVLDVEVGAQVTTSTEIARIDDRSILLVDFLVPERYVSDIREGMQVTARPLAGREAPLQGRVRAVDNRVDPVSRSLTVQAEIPNAGDRLRAGMAFAMELDFPGQTLPSVDALAIQWGRSGAFVWVLRDGRSHREPVRIVQRSGERVLVEASLRPDDVVVREGVQMLREGQEVEIRTGNGGNGNRNRGNGPDRAAASPGADPVEG